MCTPYAQKRQKLPAQGITLGYNGLKPYALKGQKLLAQGITLGYNGLKPAALKGQKLLAQGTTLGYNGLKPYALKGQKLLAQGITLGYNGLKPYALNQRSPARSGKVKGKSFPLTQTFKAKTTKNGRKILYCLLFSVSLHPFLKFSSINRIIQKNRYDK